MVYDLICLSSIYLRRKIRCALYSFRRRKVPYQFQNASGRECRFSALSNVAMLDCVSKRAGFRLSRIRNIFFTARCCLFPLLEAQLVTQVHPASCTCLQLLSRVLERKFVSLIERRSRDGRSWHNKTQARVVDRARSVGNDAEVSALLSPGSSRLPRQIGSVFNEHDDSSSGLNPQIYRRDTARLPALTRLSSLPP